MDCTGGNNVEALGDAWLLNTTTVTWTPVEAAGEAPSARLGHVGFARGAALFLHGGRLLVGDDDDVSLSTGESGESVLLIGGLIVAEAYVYPTLCRISRRGRDMEPDDSDRRVHTVGCTQCGW